MPVIPLTITVSLCLVFTFVVFFIRENARRFSNAERESLLPLADETPRLEGAAAANADDRTRSQKLSSTPAGHK